MPARARIQRRRCAAERSAPTRKGWRRRTGSAVALKLTAHAQALLGLAEARGQTTTGEIRHETAGARKVAEVAEQSADQMRVPAEGVKAAEAMITGEGRIETTIATMGNRERTRPQQGA